MASFYIRRPKRNRKVGGSTGKRKSKSVARRKSRGSVGKNVKAARGAIPRDPQTGRVVSREGGKLKRNRGSVAAAPVRSPGFAFPNTNTWPSGFRDYCMRLPKNGTATVYALVEFDMGPGYKGETKSGICPVDMGRLGKNQALALTLDEVKAKLDSYQMKVTGAKVTRFVRVVALKPEAERKFKIGSRATKPSPKNRKGRIR